MHKIILEKEDASTIPFSVVDEQEPIFAKRNDKLVGMVVQEDDGWILRLGGKKGADGHHATLWKCLKSCLTYGNEFFIESSVK